MGGEPADDGGEGDVNEEKTFLSLLGVTKAMLSLAVTPAASCTRPASLIASDTSPGVRVNRDA